MHDDPEGSNVMAMDRGYGSAWPRWISLAVGIWVFISAFVWPHTAGEQTNTWILGVLIVIGSLAAMQMPNVRYLNTLFAIWLFFATLVITHSQAGTLWSNLLSAIVVFVMSLIPSGESTVTTGSQRPLHA
jgi:hypothetical protein